VDGGQGTLVFTVGASPTQGMGFRVYTMFNNSTVNSNQLVAVFDGGNGDFKGVIIGTAIGEMRTGAIGGVAIKHLARQNAKVLGMIGTGVQAVTQLQAATEVRKFERILVYSRNQESRNEFAKRMTRELAREVMAVESPREVVTQADVLICATVSHEPLFDPGWLKKGTHITTIGPRFNNKHELPIDGAVHSDLIATDSVAQIEDIGEKYFLHSHIPLTQYVSLSDIVSGKHLGRTNERQQTLFCSIGLAGTEVAVANYALDLSQKLDYTS
jgi:ornithine cyclodeaminase/alanine dehydrogenase-like protein (mu-crystallin family)